MATSCTNKDGRLSPDKDAPLLRKSLTIKRILNCDFQHLGVFDGPYSPTKSLLLPRDENRASIAIATTATSSCLAPALANPLSDAPLMLIKQYSVQASILVLRLPHLPEPIHEAPNA